MHLGFGHWSKRMSRLRSPVVLMRTESCMDRNTKTHALTGILSRSIIRSGNLEAKQRACRLLISAPFCWNLQSEIRVINHRS